MTNFDYYSEFKDYATKHLGVSGLQFHYWEKLQDRIYSHNSALTPYILEERELRVTQMDIFSRLMMDRILWVAGPVNDNMSTVVQAQLMFLDNVEVKNITGILHINVNYTFLLLTRPYHPCNIVTCIDYLLYTPNHLAFVVDRHKHACRQFLEPFEHRSDQFYISNDPPSPSKLPRLCKDTFQDHILQKLLVDQQRQLHLNQEK